MKKLILVGAIVLASIVGIMVVKNRLGVDVLSSTTQQGPDLIVVNDSSDTISTEYADNGQEVAQILKPGDQITGGQGFIRIFTAKKAGAYELTYQFPRPADALQQVTLSQVIAAAKDENFGDRIITRKGMIGDIKVEYEEVRVLASTY